MAADSDGQLIAGFSARPKCLGHKLGITGGSQLHHLPSTCEEDHDLIQTVFTCHGNLEDPDFPQRFSHLLEQLSTILCTGKEVLMRRVKKVEPWNSVRVTLTIPREAAARLRTLAAAGDAALQALGILSVQLEGDQVISLRLAARFGSEPQEIVLRTSNGSSSEEPNPVTTSSAAAASAAAVAGPVAALLNSVAGPSGSSSFRSPNVVAPPTNALIPPSPKPHAGPSPFPFTSMTHAAQTHQARQESPHHNFTAPPPYTAKAFTPAIQRPNHPASSTAMKLATMTSDTTVSLSSPLLVNLLQTDGKEPEPPRPRQPTAPSRVRQRPPAPRLPAPPSVAPMHRFPPAAAAASAVSAPVTVVTPVASSPAVTVAATSSSSSVAVTAAVATLTPSPSPLRPAFAAGPSKEVVQPRSVMQSYSQFTASTSKPCSSTELAEKCEEKSNSADGKKLIINPLTGELEPMPSESSESDEDMQKDDPFVYSSSPASRVYSDDDSIMSRRNDTSDQSDSETTSRSNGSDGAVRRRLIGAHKPSHHAPEKIKLRLMLDKSEPGQQVSSAPSNAYKVDLSFSPSVRKTVSSGNRAAASPPSSVPSPPVVSQSTAPCSVSPGEEPRVPPLHISLRGRNAAVVSNRKKSPHWILDDEIYNKIGRKKVKLGSGSAKDGRDSIAINNCDLSQKPKRGKMKRLLGVADGEGLKLKIPVMPDMDLTDLCDEKLSKKRKDSKKVKNNVRHSESDSDGKGLKMDSEEWISRTLKEETLRNSVPLDSEVPASESAVSALVDAAAEVEGSVDAGRTSGVFELSELLRCKKVENSNKKLDCLKIKNKLLDLQLEEPEPVEMSSVKKPQEIGGKIKSELSSKIDRVSGKLKNDLSKDGQGKKKLEDPGGKVIKAGIRPKPVKKEGGTLVRLASLPIPSSPSEGEDLVAFNRTKRRHSGDQSAPESQAQKVRRSSSSDQPSPSKLPTANRRFDALARKIRKDCVIDRLRKDKLGKVVPLNAKLTPGSDPHNKKVQSSRLTSCVGGNPVEKSPVVVSAMTALVEVKPALTRLEGEAEKLKEGAGGAESSTQGEDSGIESMDALSEKSPNQGESPCRKEDDGKKGQNHDRTEEEEVKELTDNNCLTMGSSNQEPEPPQAHTVPFQCSPQNNNNNNSVEPEPETSTKLNDPSLIESFGSKIREAFRRDEGLAAKILEGSAKDWEKDKEEVKTETNEEDMAAEDVGEATETSDSKADSCKDSVKEVGSPSSEDLERFRVNPPLYTYAKREDSLSPSPTTVEGNDQTNRSSIDEDNIDEDSNNRDIKLDAIPEECETNHVKSLDDSSRKTSKLEDIAEDASTDSSVCTGKLMRHNKSLLEQLLIEIPPDDTRRTRSWNKLGSSPGNTPKSSPRPSSPSVARPSPRTGSKLSPTPRGSKRPSKRKCSENAAELIKACMGLDESKAVGKLPNANNWKRGEMESSDDEPLSDLARSREQSVEQDVKPGVLKPKIKQISIDDENRNNTKIGIKVVADTPTRRSVRQTQASAVKNVRSIPDRTVRSKRSALTQESCETGNKRRRTSRDGK